MGTPVRAISRVRPLLESDGCSNGSSTSRPASVVEAAPAASQIILGHDHFCDFDAVFGPDVSQKEIYTSCLEDLVTSFFEGYNVSVVGYGARGSGKTHTITGPGFLWAMNEEQFGLLPRAVRQLYRHIAECRMSCAGLETHVSVSYLLLCAGAVYDLLSSQNVLSPLPILADHKGSVMVPGLSSIDCNSITEVLNCLEAGLVTRHNHASTVTSPNYARDGSQASSSSPPHTHASFTITLQQERQDKDGRPRVLCSRLNFVDLSGLDQQSASLQHLSGPGTASLQTHSYRGDSDASAPPDQRLHHRNLGSDGYNKSNNNVPTVAGGEGTVAARNAISRDPSAVGSPCSNSYTNTEVIGGVGACADREQARSGSSFNLLAAEAVGSGGVLGVDDGYNLRQLRSNSEDHFPAASEGEEDSLLVEKGCGDGGDDDLCAEEEEEEDGVESSTTVMSGAGVVMSPDHQCLASVIACLVDPNFSGPVPYAHSMLTQLLKEGLGGNCLTLLVCCAAPTRPQLPATLLTMRYGGLARYILNRPIVNDVTAQLEAARLQEQQQAAWGVNSVVGTSSVGGSEASVNVGSSATASTLPVTSNAEANALNNNNNNTTCNNTNVVKNIDPEELFRMQWLVWQLQQLVEGADCLLRAGLPFLPPALQGQAGAWLRHRADPAAHCAFPPLVGGQQPSPSPLWPGAQGGSLLLRAGDDRTLHVIEELSEPGDLKTSSRNDSSSAGGGTTPATPAATGLPAADAAHNSEDGSERSYDSAGSSSSSLGEEFHEQLAVLATQFADYTASLVRAVEDRLDSFSEHATSAAPSSSDDEESSVALVPETTKEAEDLDSSHEKMDTERAFSEVEDTDDSEEQNESRKVKRSKKKCRRYTRNSIGRNSRGDQKINLSASVNERLLNSINTQNFSISDEVVVPVNSTSTDVVREAVAPASHNSIFSCNKDVSCNDSNKQEEAAPTSQRGEVLDGRGGLGSLTPDDEESDANMDSYDSEDEEGEDTVSSDDVDEEDAEPSIREPRPPGLSRTDLWQCHSGGRRCSTAGLPTHLHEAPSSFLGALPLQEHEANRRKKRELQETIREKESQLHELQRKARWLEQLLHQNQATLLQLQQLTDAEAARLADARRRARAVEAHREQHRTACSAVLQHERTLQQYRERSKRLQNLVKIMDDTKLPPAELESLFSRLRELRCELAEVETAVREDEQRKQHLTRLRRDRPRRQSGGRQAADEDMDDDLDPLISSSPIPTTSSSTCPSKRLQGHVPTPATALLPNTSDGRPGTAGDNTTAQPPHAGRGSSQSCGSGVPPGTRVSKDSARGGSGLGGTECQYEGSVRRERVAAGSEEHITLRRGGSKAVVSVHGLSQPHKRRLLSSSSEQCQSSADGQSLATGGGSQKLRAQISRLRDARDALAAWRQRINRKMRRGVTTGVSGSAAERRLLELDEAVEAVDNAIEYKNELLCGRTTEMVKASVLVKQGKLLDCLLTLSDEELRTLLLKYFNRVIDLRIEFRMQEISSSELEVQFEDQGRQLQRLKWSYQQASLDMERKCAVQQRQHLHHLHKLFRHIHEQEAAYLQPNLLPPSQDSSSSGPLVRELEMSLYYYKDQCTQLKTLIKQQQGLGYNFQPVYQQLQQQDQEPGRGKAATRHQQQALERRTADIGLKLTSLGPGGSLLPRPHPAVHDALVHEEPQPHHQTAHIHAAIEAPDNVTHHQHGNETNVVQQHQLHRTAGGNTREPEPQQPFRHHGSSHNPFMRRSHLEPRSRKRPPSSASRYLRGLGGDTRGLARVPSGSTGGRAVESVPMVDFRFRLPHASHSQQQ